MRTLVVSDLHLGLLSGYDRLRDPVLRASLLAALADVERLLLLGDLIEFRDGPARAAIDVATGVLSELGRALGPGREVVIVPGNHDHRLLDDWLARRGGEAPPLGLESAVDWREGELLAAVAGALAPAEVRVAYPGVWLAPGVWATHGHYLDALTRIPALERLAVGVTARLLRREPSQASRAEDFEAVLAPVYAWLHATAERGNPPHDPHAESPSHRAWRRLQRGEGEGGWRRHATRVAFPAMVAILNRAGLGPLRAEVDGPALRRGSLRAFEGVLTALGVRAQYVLFGHTHRAGPLPGDEPSEWRTASGTQLINTGCWVHEPGFLERASTAPSYRAGFAALLQDGCAPELVNLPDPG